MGKVGGGMTIEELIRKVKDKGVGTKINGSILTLHEIHEYNMNFDPFLEDDIRTELAPPFLECDMLDPQFATCKTLDRISDLNIFDLTTVLNLVARVADTPVEERFKEQVWRLRWLHPKSEKDDYSGYLCRDSDGFWQIARFLSEATLFTSSDLEKLKAEKTTFAPAIDAVKEPAVNDK